MALRLWLQSPGAYREISMDLVMPSTRTLQRLKSSLPRGPGWHPEIIQAMSYVPLCAVARPCARSSAVRALLVTLTMLR